MGTLAKSGFTLIEAAVGLTIAAVLAAAFYFSFNASSSAQGGDDRAQRAAAAAASLFDIASAIAALETTNPPVSFLQTVGAYPAKLSQITTQITTADRNSCNRPTDAYLGTTPPNPAVNPGYTQGWKGPYYIVAFPLNGTVQLAPGFIVQDSMIRIPSSPPGNNPSANQKAGRLQMVFNGVTQADAVALDVAVDSVTNRDQGTVRYGTSDPTIVFYELRVSGC